MWSSPEGATWTKTQDMPTAAVAAAVVFNGALWVATIIDGPAVQVSFWDGKSMNWSSPVRVGLWSTAMICLLIFNSGAAGEKDTLWLIDGAAVWRSTDGLNWTGGQSLLPLGNAPVGQPISAVCLNGTVWMAWVQPATLGFPPRSAQAFWGSTNGQTILNPQAVPQEYSQSISPTLFVFNSQIWMETVSNSDFSGAASLLTLSQNAWNQVAKTPGRGSIAPQSLLLGTMRPKYLVLSVVYSPPGSSTGTPSQVSYNTASSMATTVSNTSSFQDSTTVGFGIGEKNVFSASTDFTFTQGSSDTQTVTASTATGNTVTVPGPATDSIDHNEDLFYLWLNPSVSVSIDQWNYTTQSLGIDGPSMQVQSVNVGWLNGAKPMPAGVRAILTKAGITSDDYAQILTLNPFAANPAYDPGSDPNQTRYAVVAGTSFDYTPPFNPNDKPRSRTYSLTQQNAVGSSHTTTLSYSVGVSVTGEAGADLQAKLSVKNTETWTHSTTTGSTFSNSQAAQATVTEPAYGYAGPTQLTAYLDSVYNTFVLVFSSSSK